MELQEIVNRSISERYTYPDIFTDDIGLDSIIPGKPLHAIPSWGMRPSNDLDLIAVRWKDNYESPKYMVEQFVKEISHYVFAEDIENNLEEITNYEVRFNTHYHFTIPIYKDWYIDLCVII